MGASPVPHNPMKTYNIISEPDDWSNTFSRRILTAWFRHGWAVLELITENEAKARHTDYKITSWMILRELYTMPRKKGANNGSANGTQNSQTQRLTTYLPVSLNWSTTDMGLVLNLLIKERPDLAPSSDPIYTIQASLMDCPVLGDVLETPYLLPCINMTFCSRATSPTSQRVIRIYNRNDALDRLFLLVWDI